jgi:hypothetical protein
MLSALPPEIHDCNTDLITITMTRQTTAVRCNEANQRKTCDLRPSAQHRNHAIAKYKTNLVRLADTNHHPFNDGNSELERPVRLDERRVQSRLDVSGVASLSSDQTHLSNVRSPGLRTSEALLSASWAVFPWELTLRISFVVGNQPRTLEVKSQKIGKALMWNLECRF